jgi:hypothetical protein
MAAALRVAEAGVKSDSFPESKDAVNFSGIFKPITTFVVDKLKTAFNEENRKKTIGAITWVAVAIVLGVFCPPALVAQVLLTGIVVVINTKPEGKEMVLPVGSRT